MSIQRFETGPRMSQVVVNGNTVYLAGVVANKARGKSTTEQTQEILSIIDGHLAKAGTDKSKLLSTNIYITDMKNFAEMNAVWDKWVSPGNTPARATVEAGLATPTISSRSWWSRRSSFQPRITSSAPACGQVASSSVRCGWGKFLATRKTWMAGDHPTRPQERRGSTASRRFHFN